LDERLARLEAIVEAHERQLDELRDHMKHINEELSDVRAALAGLTQSLNDLKEGISKEQKRSMWKVGLIAGGVVTVAAALFQVLLIFALHLG